MPRPTPQARPTASNSTLKPPTENLITRYNLESKINAEATENNDGGDRKQENAWSQNKTERQQMLQRRRDDMILAARRRMLEKEQGHSGP